MYKLVRKIPRFFILYYGLAALWLITTAMHIPDGYLSPITSIVTYLIVLPFWMRGLQQLRQKINAKNIPLIAFLAAFSFVIMMFNIPIIPGGTSAHAIGAALAAIILGPEIATMAISTALVIQALFFGDGGITAIGANCLNMAVVAPYVSYAIYQAFSKNQPLNSNRRILGATLGGWSGLTAASFFAGVEFGIQPFFWHTATGAPLYAPYPLSVSIPAMLIPHALFASVAEGLVTALAVAYLQRANQSALAMVSQPGLAIKTGRVAHRRAQWIGLAVLIFATPIGLLAPGTAWGEWSTEKLSGLGLSFIPAGMQQLSGLWPAPLKNYDLPVLGNANLGYILSALVGALMTIIVVWLFSMLAARSQKNSTETVSNE